MSERYSNKYITVREHWYIQRMKVEDIEAAVLLLKSRCLDNTLDFWSMSLHQLHLHLSECAEAMKISLVLDTQK
jgi:hypothetical protein